ncbi:hypothetical protein COX60_02200 [Candidatus Berkelbacteria bacterium CG_4_10_14_0_2_um_filter_35_9_33_12]|uniref:Oligosaccharide repeat unit polymerase n=1 Tax=Candidatus Berkelbacteria bacterium CG_4_10_14_0_2_um_filter_35_9_33_12 TaxID=1974499 RepID=A0A2M7W3X3_9BACT|nr:MAG: hypothetical protein COX60_02200 [Candidatus Berkelbacteria bacterium CG_4_10_14_0_2_um_filter_35_9_33_12]
MGFFIRIKNSNYRFFVLLLALLLLQSIIFGSIYLLKGLPYQLILSVIFTTTVCLTPLVFSLIKSKDLLAPPVGVGFMIFFFYVPSAIYGWHYQDKIISSVGDYLDDAVLLAGIGFLMILLGYNYFGLIHKHLKHRLISVWEPNRAIFISIFLYLIGFALRINYFSSISNIGGLFNNSAKVVYTSGDTQLIGFLLNLPFIALLMYTISYFKLEKNNRYKLLVGLGLALLIILEIVMAFPTSRRWYIFQTLVYVFVPIYYLYKKFSSQSIIIGMTLFSLFIILFFPLMNIHRQSVIEQYQKNSNLGLFDAKTLSLTKQEITKLIKEKSYLNFIYEEQMRRYDQSSVLGAIISDTPEQMPFQNGKTIFPGLIGALIPRFIWADKPTMFDQNMFGWRYGFIAPNDDNTTVLFSYIGELYLNFAWLGVIIGMFIYGIFFRYVYELCIGGENSFVQSSLGIFIYTLFWTQIVHIEGLFIPALGGTIQTLILLLPILLFINNRNKVIT